MFVIQVNNDNLYIVEKNDKFFTTNKIEKATHYKTELDAKCAMLYIDYPVLTIRPTTQQHK